MLSWVRVCLATIGWSKPVAPKWQADEARPNNALVAELASELAVERPSDLTVAPPPVLTMEPGTLVPHLFAHALREIQPELNTVAQSVEMAARAAANVPKNNRNFAKRLAVVNKLNAPAGRNKGRVKIQDSVGKPMPRIQSTPVAKRGPALRSPVAPIQQSARPAMSADIICLATVRRDQHTTLVGRAA